MPRRAGRPSPRCSSFVRRRELLEALGQVGRQLLPCESEPPVAGLAARQVHAGLTAEAQHVLHRVHRGVFVAVCGPNLETRAEYRFLRTIGADVVGMSTVPEVIAARHLGMKVLGISIITDECFPDSLQPVLLEEMLQAVTIAEPVVADIIRYVVQHADRSE